MRVLVLAGDVDGNLGDRAILGGTLDGLRELDPAVQVTTLSTAPERLARELGIRALRRGPRSLPGMLAAAARADAVLIGGGGLFQDDDSLVKMPFWAALVALVRLVQPNILGHALGVGPLNAGISRVTGRLALRLLRRVTVRDAHARDVAQALTAKPVVVVPDPALLLRPAPPSEAEAVLAATGRRKRNGLRIGVALRRFVPQRVRIVPRRLAERGGGPSPEDIAVNEGWIDLIAEALDQFMARHGGEVVFMPSYDRDHEGDVTTSEAVRRRMRFAATHIARLEEPRLYKAVCGQLDLMVGGRMHPTILTAGMRRPVCGLSYNQKFEGFFGELGCPDLVLPVGKLVAEGDAAPIVALMEQALARGPVPDARLTELETRIRNHLEDVLRDTGTAPQHHPEAEAGEGLAE